MVYPGTESVIAVELSPLPNLLSKMSAGAELVHHVKLTPLGAELDSGEVSTKLSLDRAQLSVTLSSAGVCPGQLQLVRVAADQLSSGELLALVVLRGSPGEAECGNYTRHFHAADHYRLVSGDAFGDLALETLGESRMIDGTTLHPAQKPVTIPVIEEHLTRLGRRACRGSVDRYRSHGVPDEKDYLRKRMLTEIMAALHSQRPSVASVHISLANLYALRIGMGASLLEDQAS
jgi:hypothetical protein